MIHGVETFDIFDDLNNACMVFNFLPAGSRLQESGDTLMEIKEAMRDLREQVKEWSRQSALTRERARESLLRMVEFLKTLRAQREIVAATRQKYARESKEERENKLDVLMLFDGALKDIDESVEKIRNRIDFALARVPMQICPATEIINRVCGLCGGADIVSVHGTVLQDKIRGDPFSLTSAFYNILNNAVHFANKRKREDPLFDGKAEVNVYLRRDRHDVIVDITDNGAGISAGLLTANPATGRQRLMDLNCSARSGGTGLGLTESWHVVQDHKGKMDVRSQYGKTVFTIHLPALTEKSPISSFLVRLRRTFAPAPPWNNH